MTSVDDRAWWRRLDGRPPWMSPDRRPTPRAAKIKRLVGGAAALLLSITVVFSAIDRDWLGVGSSGIATVLALSWVLEQPRPEPETTAGPNT